MDEFTSQNLELVLGVKEGSHFDRVLKPTVVIATLNGRCLESKKIQANCNPQYATDLIWDTDRNALRKMRCNQTPIKVECYAVNDNGSREKLGYILLSVRSAQIIHRGKESTIKTRWHNVLGVRNDFNDCKPQLLLYLIIREKINHTIPKNKASSKLNIAPINEENSSIHDYSPRIKLPESKSVSLPKQNYFEEEANHINPHSRIPMRNINEENSPIHHNSPRSKLPESKFVSLPKQNYFKEEANRINPHNRIPSASSLEKDFHSTEKLLSSKNTSKKCELHQSVENISIPTNRYASYRLNVCIKKLEFFDSRPKVKNIEFRFYHPHGEMVSAISKKFETGVEQTVELENVESCFYFISHTDEIEHLLTRFAPRINICGLTSTDERKCIAQVSLDVKRLFIRKKPECHYVASLIDCHLRKEIGNAEITMVLQDSELSVLNKIQEETSETVLDNRLAYKIVDELETWKERQKEMFKDQLRKKEETHLRLLNEEWRRRREYLESKLATSIEQCKLLTNNLSQAIQDLRERKIQSLEKETKLIQANENLQYKYDRKLHQLQETLQTMQEEFSTKLKSLEEQNTSLLLQIKFLNEKNCELEKTCRDQNEKLEAHKKSSSTENQMTSTLQQITNLEKILEDTQQSKDFFKDQWSKAVKEIHRLKMKNSKTELNDVDLEEILHADSTALTYDQMALNQIQREIDIMHPESSLQYVKSNVTNRMLNSLSDVCINTHQYHLRSDTSTNSSSSDGKINMLIEKRDFLLKHGNLTSEDEDIIKLNAEIRSLLMSS